MAENCRVHHNDIRIHDQSIDVSNPMTLDGSTTTALDLPQLYTRPMATELLTALNLLAIKPPSWDLISRQQDSEAQTAVSEEGIPKYLTGIVASRLSWVEEQRREEIWEAASKRLSERSGRTAIPAVSRTFLIPNPLTKTSIAINLHEPSLTSDNLGHKTWVASYLLAKRLPILLPYLPSLLPPARDDKHGPNLASSKPPTRILELGAGTGLVGIAAAALFPAHVHLTDLPAIIPNLLFNASKNENAITPNGGKISTGVLDWSNLPSEDDHWVSSQKADVIVAADPLYSPLHPGWLADTIERFLQKGEMARAVVELPIREAYMPEFEEFKRKMKTKGFTLVVDGNELGYDDWGDGRGSEQERAEVTCWWGIWGWDQS